MRVEVPQLFDGNYTSSYPFARTIISAVSTVALLAVLVCLVAIAI